MSMILKVKEYGQEIKRRIIDNERKCTKLSDIVHNFIYLVENTHLHVLQILDWTESALQISAHFYIVYVHSNAEKQFYKISNL